jgi:hypothetical protein
MRFLFILLFTVSFAANAGTIAVDGKLYTISETRKAGCGTPGDGQYEAARLDILKARSIGEAAFNAACQAPCSNDACRKACETCKEKVESGLERLFSAVRQYPSRYSGQFCQSIRELCADECRKASRFSDERCFTECSQYESYNR